MEREPLLNLDGIRVINGLHLQRVIPSSAGYKELLCTRLTSTRSDSKHERNYGSLIFTLRTIHWPLHEANTTSKGHDLDILIEQANTGLASSNHASRSG